MPDPATAPVVDLEIEDPRWNDTDLATLAPRAVALALDAAGIRTRAVEVVILACDDAEIATLNSRFRGKSQATNVLSWPALDLFPDTPGGAPSRVIPPDPFGATGLGDIAIAFETVTREAHEGGIPLDHHILHLILHACLHLLGYDHVDDADADVMESLEVAALASAGIASPY
ncbi:rRNA maturation RNase YbeY [Halovulum dunhuangense]|uniref:Endoribonuclease YbeY n=1 Tax=Halovulum dunhuangense TaxID=1505036 RepID=A0A849KUV7_9RHOB|nr:rRNA maturation RNase YbeY [Halovulum dunhuangense]NNU79411.1 rRNA maturation RNase YbeY [Halovulum dunhuangense]